MPDILINGEKKDTISVLDRGFQYGDGLFETMAVRDGTISLWQAHWERLLIGCSKLSITQPDKATIESEIKLLCEDNNNDEKAVIKLMITRGAGERGYRFSSNQNVSRILSYHPWPDYPVSYQKYGVAVRFCETTLSENIKLAGIKHLNRLEQIMARNEWATNEFQEGLMLSTKGNVIDGTMSNIFTVKNNIICTPDLSFSGVCGVMRNTIIDLAESMGLPVHEKALIKTDLEEADELFLTNSLFGIWPVRKLAAIQFPLVGKITFQLQQALKNIR